MINIKKDVKN